MKDRYDVDFYFGVWDEIGTKLDLTPDNARQWKEHKIEHTIYDADINRNIIPREEIVKTVCPILTVPENILYIKHADHHSNILRDMQQCGLLDANIPVSNYAIWLGNNIPSTAWHQWYLVKAAYRMIETSGIKYDMVIRTRMDTAWVGYPNFELYDKVQVPYANESYPHDYLLYGPSELMRIICNVYDHLPTMYKDSCDGAGVDSHFTMLWAIQNLVAGVGNEVNKMSIIRAHSYPNRWDVSFLLEPQHAENWKNIDIDSHTEYKAIWGNI
jgi:hypothetical protein